MSSGKRQEGDIVGDYRLMRAVSEGQLTRTWEADQVSMARPVMLEMLKSLAGQDAGVVSAFLADVRAKALLTHPGVGAVYEAVNDEAGTFYARERLEGESLEELHGAGRQFFPIEIVVLLGQIAEAMRYLEQQGVAVVEYALHHFIVTGREHVRLMNLAVEGERDIALDTRAKELLGEVFDDMTKKGEPGATRVRSLCGFMADLDRPVPLTWEQIVDLCAQVHGQLRGTTPVETPPLPEVPYEPKPRRKVPSAVWALLAGVGLISALILFVIFSQNPRKPALNQPVEPPVTEIEIPAARYELGDGRVVEITTAYRMQRCEVTLAQYHHFLEFPDIAKFRHPDQPASKKDHRPDDWKAMWAAAVKHETWQGREMLPSCPIVGIDWWDAYAYANWANGRLPTLAEWSAAAAYQGAPATAAPWRSVEIEESDLTGAGLLGMSGNVREWTLQPEVNPSAPLAPKTYVAAGTSYEDLSGSTATRLWLASRSVRRNDLGCRIVIKP